MTFFPACTSDLTPAGCEKTVDKYVGAEGGIEGFEDDEGPGTLLSS